MSFFAGLFTLRTMAIILGVIAIFLLRRFFPRRNIYLLFLALVLALGTALHLLTPATEEPFSPEERNARLLQQQLVADWHKKYQRTIDTLDHTWKQYHLVLNDFSADLISLDEAHERLQRLDRQSTATLEELKAAEPPARLEPDNYELVLAVITKTRTYAAAQQLAIHSCAAASSPDHQLSEVQQEQSRALQEIMIKEAPAGLFTANEISALRDNVAVPE